MSKTDKAHPATQADLRDAIDPLARPLLDTAHAPLPA